MTIFQDVRANNGRPHIQLLLVIFRVAQSLRSSNRRAIRIVAGRPVSVFYRAVALFLFSVDIPVTTRVGPGLAVHHGIGIVVHSKSRIGSNVILRQATTIGSNGHGGTPAIGDGVSIGPQSCIIGGVTLGDFSIVGAGSVVIRDVEPYSTVAGNPARVLASKIDASQG